MPSTRPSTEDLSFVTEPCDWINSARFWWINLDIGKRSSMALWDGRLRDLEIKISITLKKLILQVLNCNNELNGRTAKRMKQAA